MVDGLVSVFCITEEIRLYYWEHLCTTLFVQKSIFKINLTGKLR